MLHGAQKSPKFLPFGTDERLVRYVEAKRIALMRGRFLLYCVSAGTVVGISQQHALEDCFEAWNCFLHNKVLQGSLPAGFTHCSGEIRI